MTSSKSLYGWSDWAEARQASLARSGVASEVRPSKQHSNHDLRARLAISCHRAADSRMSSIDYSHRESIVCTYIAIMLRKAEKG